MRFFDIIRLAGGRTLHALGLGFCARVRLIRGWPFNPEIIIGLEP